MSYMICPTCGEANGMVNTTIFQCKCVRKPVTQLDAELVALMQRIGACFDDGSVDEQDLKVVRDYVRSRIEQATAGAYEACRLKMLTLNDEFWSAVAAKDCVELMPEDAKRALAQAVAKARLESAKKVISHAPGRLPQAVQDYIAELERQLAEVKGAERRKSDR